MVLLSYPSLCVRPAALCYNYWCIHGLIHTAPVTAFVRVRARETRYHELRKSALSEATLTFLALIFWVVVRGACRRSLKGDLEDEQFEESDVPLKPPWRSILLAVFLFVMGGGLPGALSSLAASDFGKRATPMLILALRIAYHAWREDQGYSFGDQTRKFTTCNWNFSSITNQLSLFDYYSEEGRGSKYILASSAHNFGRWKVSYRKLKLGS